MINAAIVGLGRWGKRLSGFVAGSERIRFVRGVEPNPSAVDGFSETCGFPISTSYAEALADAQVDAVVLATPHSKHEEQIEAAAAAGKHVFCEKPLALSRASAERSVARCREANLVLGIGHERRFEPPLAEVLRMAREGELGTILHIESNFSHNRLLKFDPSNWRLSTSEAPAGNMTATGIHILDLATAMLGPASSAKVVCERLASDLAIGDTTTALVHFKSGATAVVTSILVTPFISRLAIFGSKGWIEIRDKAHMELPAGWLVTKCFAEGKLDETEAPGFNSPRANLEAFAMAVEGEAPYPISTDEMIANTAIMEAIFRSAASGREEVVPS